MKAWTAWTFGVNELSRNKENGPIASFMWLYVLMRIFVEKQKNIILFLLWLSVWFFV